MPRQLVHNFSSVDGGKSLCPASSGSAANNINLNIGPPPACPPPAPPNKL